MKKTILLNLLILLVLVSLASAGTYINADNVRNCFVATETTFDDLGNLDQDLTKQGAWAFFESNPYMQGSGYYSGVANSAYFNYPSNDFINLTNAKKNGLCILFWNMVNVSGYPTSTYAITMFPPADTERKLLFYQKNNGAVDFNCEGGYLGAAYTIPTKSIELVGLSINGSPYARNAVWRNTTKVADGALTGYTDNKWSKFELGHNVGQDRSWGGSLSQLIIINGTGGCNQDIMNEAWNDRETCAEILGTVGDIAPNPPTFVFPTPLSGTTNFTLPQIINMSADATLRYFLWWGNTTAALDLVLNNATEGNWTMNISGETMYYYRGASYNITSSLFSVNTTLRNFTYDITPPAITPIGTLFNNNTIVINGTLTTEINFSDNLEIYLVNVTLANGSIIFNVSNYGSKFLWLNISETDLIGTSPSNSIRVLTCDTHTNNEMGTLSHSKINGGIKYITGYNKWVWIYPKDYINYKTPTTTKLSDKYTFEFNKKSSFAISETYIVESNNKIDIPNSKRYGGHSITNLIWIDFVNPDATKHEIKRISDKKIEVIVYGLKGSSALFDSVGAVNCVNKTYHFGNLNPASNYTTNEITGALSNFYLNVTTDPITMRSGVNATLYYNGTKYSLGNISNYSINLPATYPISGDIENISLFWSVTINNIEYNLTKFNQTVYDFVLDNCSSAPTISLNTSLKNETTDAFLTGTIDFSMNYWYGLNPALTKNYTGRFTGNNQTFCIFPSWVNLNSDMVFEFYTTTPLFNYFTNNISLTNRSRLINLYIQDETTQVLFTVQDIDSNPIENAYIQILKYDVSKNSYKAVEVLKTDSQGQAIGNIVLGTVFYNFFIYYQGRLVYTEQAVKLIATTRTFTVNLEGTDWLDDYIITLGVGTDLYFNNATNNFVYVWADPTSAVHNGCMKVDESNKTGKFLLDESCIASASGTIIYNIPSLKNGSTYTATGYLKYDSEIITDIVQIIISPTFSFYHNYPTVSLFFATIFCIAMFLMGIPQPAISLALLGFGVIFSSLLGWWAISALQIGSIIFLILVQLFLINRK